MTTTTIRARQVEYLLARHHIGRWGASPIAHLLDEPCRTVLLGAEIARFAVLLQDSGDTIIDLADTLEAAAEIMRDAAHEECPKLGWRAVDLNTGREHDATMTVTFTFRETAVAA